MNPGRIRIAVLVSGRGRGSNMQAIIDACRDGKINGDVVLVVGVRDEAPAMERARAAGVKTVTISPADCADPADYDAKLIRALDEHSIDLVCLAGYMRLLGPEIVKRYRNRILNVHPALIPSFAGKGMFGHHVHEAVVESGVKYTGVTVHLVDEHYDHGPIVLQAVVPVEEDDTPESLAAKVLPVEHETYTRAVALFAEGRIQVCGRRTRILPQGQRTEALHG